MKFSRDNSNYSFSCSTKTVHHRNSVDEKDNNGGEVSIRSQFLQTTMSQKNSDRFRLRRMGTVFEGEHDPYIHHGRPDRKKSYTNEVGRRLQEDRGESYISLPQRFKNDAVFYGSDFKTSDSRSREISSFYEDSYRYKPRPGARYQCRISSGATTSFTTTSVTSRAKTSYKDHQDSDTYKCNESTKDSRNYAYLDRLNLNDDNEKEEYCNTKPPAVYQVEKTRVRVQGLDNDDDDDSDLDRKMPAKPRGSELSPKPETGLSDFSNPAEESTKTIEVSPGCVFRLRGADETWNAVLKDFYMPHQCVCCEVTVFCIQDADYLICPTCRIINPLPGAELNEGRGGVGLGFLVEDLAIWQSKIAKERQILSKKNRL